MKRFLAFMAGAAENAYRNDEVDVPAPWASKVGNIVIAVVFALACMCWLRYALA